MQVQSHIQAMEDLRKKMEAQLVLAHQEIEATKAKNEGLQAIMKSLKEQCKPSVLDGHQEYSTLNVGSLLPPFGHPSMHACIHVSAYSLCLPIHLTGPCSACLTFLLLLLALHLTMYLTGGTHLTLF